jgi:hypothetical protein
MVRAICFASQQTLAAHVGDGSDSEVTACPRHVRFPPGSGHPSVPNRRRLWARRGHSKPSPCGARCLGYVEGHNFAVVFCSAEGRADRLSALAEEIVRTAPDLILAVSTPVAIAVQQRTKTIPIVFALTADPVGAGARAQAGRRAVGIIRPSDSSEPGPEYLLCRELVVHRHRRGSDVRRCRAACRSVARPPALGKRSPLSGT